MHIPIINVIYCINNPSTPISYDTFITFISSLLSWPPNTPRMLLITKIHSIQMSTPVHCSERHHRCYVCTKGLSSDVAVVEFSDSTTLKIDQPCLIFLLPFSISFQRSASAKPEAYTNQIDKRMKMLKLGHESVHTKALATKSLNLCCVVDHNRLKKKIFFFFFKK